MKSQIQCLKSKTGRTRQTRLTSPTWSRFRILPLAFLLSQASLSPAADSYTELRQLKFGQASPALVAIQSDIASANPAQLRAIEARLIEVLQSREATTDAKSWVCRTLRMAGSERAVPALAALLVDPRLAADAQYALRSIPGPKPDEALRKALPRTQGLLKAGVIQTLGARADYQALSLIAPLAGDPDPLVAEAALYALGHIGGPEALAAVQKTLVPAGLERYREHAILLCAESLLASGDASEAAHASRALYYRSADPVIKSATLRCYVLAEGAAAGPVFIEALLSGQPLVRAAAARLLCESGSDPIVSEVLAKFNLWTPETQACVLGMVTNACALGTVRGAARGGNEQVRIAAIEALGRLGGAADVPMLVAEAASAEGRAQSAARQALQSLRGPGVSQALAAALQPGLAPARCEAARALAARNDTSAVPALLDLAADADGSVRREAQKALAQLAAPGDLPRLLGLLAQAGTDADREGIENAVAGLLQRASDRETALSALLGALPGKSSEAKCALLRLAARIPNAKSLEALRAALAGADPAVTDTAIRCLAEWPDAAVQPDLERLARSAPAPAQRALALRGLIRLAGLEAQRAPAQAAKLLEGALGVAASADDKRAILAALMEVGHARALVLAENCLADPAVEVEAANAVVRLARKLQATEPEAASDAIQRILDTCKSPAARQLAENAGVVLGDMINIAPQGIASSPDGLQKDGAAGGDQAGIDGNPDTYWDKEDNAKLYRFVVTFKQPEQIAALSIMGYQQHNFAPKDFEVLADGRAIKKVDNAQYTDNLLVMSLPETTAQAIELRITGYYGGSPAIRELGLYQHRPGTKAQFRVLVFSKTLGYRHANIPLGIAAIRRLGAQNGFGVDATEDSAAFTPENLARYKTVVFLSATGDVLNDEQQKAFKDYVLGGGGFVGIHGAMFGPSACEDKWAWYGDLCCVSFKNHSAVVPARVDVEEHANPSTLDLPDHWVRPDEWYNYDGTPRGRARVLATVQESTYQGGTVGQDHPISWCKPMGQGIMWYTAMGHTDESFREAPFLKHILGGIQLTARAKPADLTPNPKLD